MNNKEWLLLFNWLIYAFLIQEDFYLNYLRHLVEVDYGSKSNYDLGHISGSVMFGWKKDINDHILIWSVA